MNLFTLSIARTKVLTIATSSVMVVMLSCQQESSLLKDAVPVEKARIAEQFSPVDTQITGDYEVRGGTLHFRDSDAFNKIRNAFYWLLILIEQALSTLVRFSIGLAIETRPSFWTAIGQSSMTRNPPLSNTIPGILS